MKTHQNWNKNILMLPDQKFHFYKYNKYECHHYFVNIFPQTLWNVNAVFKYSFTKKTM